MVNVLGTLGLGAILCWLFVARLRPALCLLLAAPTLAVAQFVEFGLAGVLIVPVAWQMQARQEPAAPWLLLLLVGLVGLHNAQAGHALALAATLAALPLASLVRQLPVRAPRLGRAFYVFYPLHLALIGLLPPPARWL